MCGLKLIALLALTATGCATTPRAPATTRRAGDYRAPTATLTPVAQAALDTGLAAATVPDFPAALRHFEAARALASQAPEVYFNLGLAESKIPGRELRAVAWFEAYLTAFPQAPNATAVRAEADALFARSRHKVDLMVKLLLFVAGELSRQQEVVMLLAALGDLPAATKAVELIRGDLHPNQTRYEVAKAQAAVGDMVGARRMAAGIDQKDTFFRSRAETAIAHAQLTAGDTAGAKATFAAARQLVAGTESAVESGEARVAFAIALAGVGELVAAREILAPVQTTIEAISNWGERPAAHLRLAEARAICGDIPAALKTLGRMEADGYYEQSELAKALARTGHVEAALQIAADISDDEWRSRAQSGIAEAQANAEQFAGARQTLALIGLRGTQSPGLRAIAEGQLRAGDLLGARATLLAGRAAALTSPYPQFESRYLTEIAQTQIKATDGLEAARTLDAAQDACGRIPRDEAKGVTLPAWETALSNLAGVDALLGFAEGPAFEWLKLLRDSQAHHECPLNTPLFLDLDGFIKRPPSSGDLTQDFNRLQDAVRTVLKAQTALERMRKVQAKKAHHALHR